MSVRTAMLLSCLLLVPVYAAAQDPADTAPEPTPEVQASGDMVMIEVESVLYTTATGTTKIQGYFYRMDGEKRQVLRQLTLDIDLKQTSMTDGDKVREFPASVAAAAIQDTGLYLQFVRERLIWWYTPEVHPAPIKSGALAENR